MDWLLPEKLERLIIDIENENKDKFQSAKEEGDKIYCNLNYTMIKLRDGGIVYQTGYSNGGDNDANNGGN